MIVNSAFRNATVRVVRLVVLIAALALAIGAITTALSSATARADTMNWDAVAQCESGGKWNANTGNGHFGGLQFKQATWSSNGGAGSPAFASRAEQIRVAENVLQTQGVRAWPKCGPLGGSPIAWNAPAAPATGGGTACESIQAGGILGIIDLRKMCSTLLGPLAAFGQAR